MAQIKITEKQVSRLKKYKAWLDQEDTEVYYAGPLVDRLIVDSIKTEKILEYQKKMLNELEEEYQNHLSRERLHDEATREITSILNNL